ncbi:peptide chain release factor N(5)-glutamine methyltransferase [Thalassotalea sp. SU-HH00458]|uniref:peptide chain release factor N(5)-glutamine methyltransferase n=1 Tax=Thalassotalea sp. SU-HH00458 TaxID=3127657 RepID=UPI003365AB15
MPFSASDSISLLVKNGAQVLAPLSDSAKLDVRLLISHVINKPLSYLLTWPDKQLSLQEFQQFVTLFEQRRAGKPIAYILGYKEFWSLKFQVAPSTLIPRPDTEVLVETVLNNHTDPMLHCLDLGTGTGAIALALASERENWQIDAVDFQNEAVALAKSNAQHLGLSRVKIYQSDWFSNITHEKRFDLIVSNPPYIDELDEHLAQGDVRFEPKSALVAEDQGFADIEHIIKNSIAFLNDNAYLYFEHGFKQAKKIHELFLQNGFSEIETVKDYNGNERVTYACYKSHQ